MVDIREFYGDEDDMKPGKKGISLNPEQACLSSLLNQYSSRKD